MRDRIAELEEGVRRRQFSIDRLEAVAAMVGLLQDCRVSPNLRFGGPAPGGKNADHLPFVAADPEFVAHLQPGELLRRADPHDHFVLAPFKSAALDDFEFVTDMKSGRLDASDGHIGVRAARSFGQVDDDEQFRGGQRALGSAREARRIGDHAGFIAPEAAGPFRCPPRCAERWPRPEPPKPPSLS